MKNKIYHFYHIWADGKWQVPLSEHIDALLRSNLINNIYSFQVGIVGKPENREQVKSYLNKRNIDFFICKEIDLGSEHETLDEIINLEDNDDSAYILYAHTKGSYNDQKFEHDWRQNMTDLLIHRWEECVNQLSFNTIVGPSYSTNHGSMKFPLKIAYPQGKSHASYGHFNGNFWWSHLKNIKLLGKPMRLYNFDGTYDRNAAEIWVKNLCNTMIGEDTFSAYSMGYDNIQNVEVEHHTLYSSIQELISDLKNTGRINSEEVIAILIHRDEIYKNPLKLTVQAFKYVGKDGNYYHKLNFKKSFLFKDRTALLELVLI